MAASDPGPPADATIEHDGDRVTLTVLRSEPPTLLEYTWGTDVLRWRLDARPPGTLLTLRHALDRPDMAPMVAAGRHLCLAVAERLLDGDPVGVIRGRDAMAHGFERLRDAYAEKFAVVLP